MYTKCIFLALVAVASCHDLAIGFNTNGKKIFDETKQANPAIWRQANNVTVTASDNEVISRVVVKDLRPEKDGDVKIVEGGEGQNNVTIELKSPTALRGYDFQIEVYAVPDITAQKDINLKEQKSKPTENTESKDTPTIVSKDETARPARNSMKDTEASSTVLPEDCVTDVLVEDFNKESMKISKDSQDHETVEFILDTNDSAKEALKAESMTVDLPIEVNENNKDIFTSTTESDETTTIFESTTIPDNNKYDKEPMSDDGPRWNWQSVQDFKPIVEMKENTTEQTDKNKF
ncbi:uncharacterized protein LOC123711055 [Pieris brassicae]|uniref:Uncharacterized protein n=1 Tax=Pieris brassicae TaxID=7116 RepID=A0A9P0XCF8_PIEBR|nr:uncharacterized protein LOC123711055 [Pieris brassicae]CAH4029712.1 unnamed protein product [Pieris brassicae]